MNGLNKPTDQKFSAKDQENLLGNGEQTALERLLTRRKFVQSAGTGAVITALGGASYAFVDNYIAEAHAGQRKDGRPRLPPGQRLLRELKPMGGTPGDPRPSQFTFKVSGEVEHPFSLTLAELSNSAPVELALDVHCVTGWSVFDAKFKGVRLRDLAKRAGVKASARHVVIEAAHGYTANTTLEHALHEDVLLTWQLNGQRLARAHGAPVRLVNPHLYFWKSPKWVTGIRFVNRDEPGYWETRGYNNHADPWKEERYA